MTVSDIEEVGVGKKRKRMGEKEKENEMKNMHEKQNSSWERMPTSPQVLSQDNFMDQKKSFRR